MSSAAAIQYISPLGQICKEQAMAQFATGDIASSGQSVTVASPVSGATLHARRGTVTVTASGGITANSSVSLTLSNNHIKPTSVVLVGLRSAANSSATAYAIPSVSTVAAGSALVNLYNGGSSNLADGSVVFWFIVLDL
jgi:hypothetical protein